MNAPARHSGRPAVFLDRDGTLIEDRGWLRSPADVRFFPDTVPALKRLAAAGHELFIATQQSGVSRGLLAAEEVAGVNAHVVARLAGEGIAIREVLCCMHGPEDGCDCRKPNPAPLRRTAAAHGLDLARSFVVGDHPHDVDLARQAGAQGVYVRTGHGDKHRDELPAAVTAIVPGIREAADWILAVREAEARSGGLDAELDRVAGLLRGGGVAAFPTETVYGLGADARNDAAVARIFEIKGRPRFDPLIVHVAEPGMLADVAAEIPPAARELIRRFWPGPLTLVLPKRPEVSDLVTAGLPTVGVRMPRHPLALELIRRAGVPVAAPSANPFGKTSPTDAEHVAAGLGSRVDAILDGGPCPVGVESTILSFADDVAVVLRVGGLALEEIEAAIGPVRVAPPTDEVPLAPGRLLRHYAPHTPLEVVEETAALKGHAGTGLLAFRGHPAEAAFGAVEVLSRAGDLREAAAHLFAALRRLDGAGLQRIVAERAPDHGLGRAINDRLRRAAHGGA
jgi:L-threonylcarbamoyladenylate synthase